MTTNVSRRTVAKGAVWAVPAVVTASAVPAFAASPEACDTFKMNWSEGIGAFVGFPFRAVPVGSESNDPTLNVPLAVETADGQNPVQGWVYKGGLPESLTFDSSKNLIVGTPLLKDAGVHNVVFEVRLKNGQTCNHIVPVTIKEFAAEGRWTCNWGGGKQTANVIGVHWRNSTDTPICGSDFKMRLWMHAVNADLSPKTSGVSMMAAPLSSINISNYSTTSGKWSVGSPANQNLLVQDWDGRGLFCEPNKLGLDGHVPIDSWTDINTVRYLTAWAGGKCTFDLLKKHGVTRIGEGYWDLKLEEGACILPGEAIHIQIGQVGPNTVPWIGTMDVTTPVVNTTLSSVGNTYYHSGWDQPLARLNTPGVNGGINGLF